MTINRWSAIYPLADADSDSATGGCLSEPSLNYDRTTMVYNEKPSLDYMYTVGLFSAPSLQSTTKSHTYYTCTSTMSCFNLEDDFSAVSMTQTKCVNNSKHRNEKEHNISWWQCDIILLRSFFWSDLSKNNWYFQRATHQSWQAGWFRRLWGHLCPKIWEDHPSWEAKTTTKVHC